MAPRLVTASLAWLEQFDRLDTIDGKIADVARRVIARSQVVNDLLTGRALGHPMHPFAVSAPIGCWTAATTLDLLGGAAGRDGADRLVGLGVLAAAPTALSGAADWADTVGAERRVGGAHAALNLTATALYALSYVARRRGSRGAGVALGLAGATVASGAGYLGGHLAYVRGVGVNTTAFQSGPEQWTRVMPVADVGSDRPVGVRVGRVALAVLRHDARVHALESRCTHRGGPLHDGVVADGCIECPWHGSRFRLSDGAVQRGPASIDQPVYHVEVRAAEVWVRRPEPGGLRANPAKAEAPLG